LDDFVHYLVEGTDTFGIPVEVREQIIHLLTGNIKTIVTQQFPVMVKTSIQRQLYTIGNDQDDQLHMRADLVGRLAYWLSKFALGDPGHVVGEEYKERYVEVLTLFSY
jgi:hypothetical protein